MEKSVIKIKSLSDRDDDDYVPGTMASRIAMVWPLTREVCSLSKKYDAEQRLQRHITSLSRRKS